MMLRVLSLRWVPLIILFVSTSLHAMEPLVIRVEPTGWGDAGPEDIQKVLTSVGDELLRHIPPERLIRIHVVPNDAAPQVDHVRSHDGEYTVRLNVKGRYWAQFAFQFAHELGHIVSHYERGIENGLGNENRWFDEAVGETASLFVLGRMAHTWEVDPPYPHWKSFAPSLSDYIIGRAKEIPVPAPDQTPAWFTENHAALRSEPLSRRDRNRVVAAHLARLLEQHPEHWEAFRYLTLGRPDPTNSFETFLENWYFSVPLAQKPFVKDIADLLGVKCPLIIEYTAKPQ
jgi:hypothetical protein